MINPANCEFIKDLPTEDDGTNGMEKEDSHHEEMPEENL